MANSLSHSLDKENIPSHIAMIMDGNGRWAKKKGLGRIFGHHQGVKTVRRMVEACGEIGVEYLTLYAFSTENWNRPKQEVNALMELLVSTLRGEIKKLHKNKVRIHTIGQWDALPQKCKIELEEAIALTKNNTGLNLVLAISYSARWDISNALKLIAQKVEKKTIKSDEINEEVVKTHLSTSNFPDPELLIRTSGEQRISNFLLWELSYSELHFSKKLWPDFKKEDLYSSIHDYQNRERRFGKTSEQIQS